jgi:DMSO/TMAO reductase YedYZ molybdopterin-dependent catalytic subunit
MVSSSLKTLACVAALLCGAAFAQTSTQVSVTGEVKTPLTLTPAGLRAFPAEQQASFT